MRDIQASYKEELNRREQFEKERLRLESEVDMLRRASHSDSLYDQDRQEVTVESLQIKVDDLQDQVDKLETFINDQDSVSSTSSIIVEITAKVKKTILPGHTLGPRIEVRYFFWSQGQCNV